MKCRSLFLPSPFSRNLLSVLPKYLFSLPLKVLLVSNNKLVSIPEEIGKAKELMELVSSLFLQVHMNFCKEKKGKEKLPWWSSFLHFVSPCRTSAVMRSRCCRLRLGGFKPYENSISGRTVYTCCLRVSSSLLTLFLFSVFFGNLILLIHTDVFGKCSHSPINELTCLKCLLIIGSYHKVED